MTFIENDLLAQPGQRLKSRGLGLAITFTATIFLSATLLFSVQPMFTKMILPLLGGASNVWNTAMVFFQAMLLGGYIYAHLITKYFPIKAQFAVHAVVTLTGFVFLPLAIPETVVVPDGGTPTFWLLGLFALTVGMPFFALSANAPLLQRWFSLTDHKDARDPYFLYSSSNAASLLILCAYPFLIEPNLQLGEQTNAWAVGYFALFAMIVTTAIVTARRVIPESGVEQGTAVSALKGKSMVFWVILAFIPSSLMLGVTSYITNNIASAPFLWIMPLALYLLTFVIVFARRPIVSANGIGKLFPWVIIVALFMMAPELTLEIGDLTLRTSPPALAKIPILLTAYFLISLYCHAILVERRPDSSKLTIFYILMSVGGVMGGAFNALIAPVLFNGVYEFVLVMALVLFLRPEGFVLPKADKNPWRLFVIGTLAAIYNAYILTIAGEPLPYIIFITVSILSVSSLRFDTGHLFKGSLFAGLVFVAIFFNMFGSKRLYEDRSFYSVLGVREAQSEHGKIHQFIHGDTFHNFQMREPHLQKVPTSYYIEGGSIHKAVEATRHIAGDKMTVSVIGLGAGAMTCYQNPSENWTFFEIDEAVVDLAKNTEFFNYIDLCDPDATIVIGDARQKLANISAGSQDLIVVDAFSSDSIPAHLVTREALALYQSRLTPEGLIFFHTSNKFLDVNSVVARLAEDAKLMARFIDIAEFPDNPYEDMGSRAQGILVGSETAVSTATQGMDDFQIWRPSQHVKVWTDDYSSVVGTLVALSLKDGGPEAISTE